MPQNKSGHRPAGRQGKGLAQTTAKVAAAKPAKGSPIAASARPATKASVAVPVAPIKPSSRTKSAAKPAAIAAKPVAKGKTAEVAAVSAKPTAKGKVLAIAAEVTVKHAAKTAKLAGVAAEKPTKKGKKAKSITPMEAETAMPAATETTPGETAVELIAMSSHAEPGTEPAEPTQAPVEPVFDFWLSAPVFTDKPAEPWTAAVSAERIEMIPQDAFFGELAFEPFDSIAPVSKVAPEQTAETTPEAIVAAMIEEAALHRAAGSAMVEGPVASMPEEVAPMAEQEEHAAASLDAVEPVAAAPDEQPETVTDAHGTSILNRRRVDKTLFERRMKDPTAKERRRGADASAGGQEPVQRNPVNRDMAKEEPEVAAVATEEVVQPASTSVVSEKWSPALLLEDEPLVERRVAERREDYDHEKIGNDLRSKDQQTFFNETAVWMRKGGTALIGLNLLVVIAVLFLWHSRTSQAAPDMKEMQKAAAAQMAEMRRATDASEVAAYAACLGSQTARNMLLQMKTGGPTQRTLPVTSMQNTATRAQAAQIEFDLEKTANVNVHMPVLFHVGVENVGKSSALNTRVWGAVRVVDSGQEPDFRYGETAFSKEAISANDPTAKLVLYSADTAGMVTPLNDAAYQRVNSGAAYVVAYGKVLYQDIFGVHHWAEFCRAITQPTGAQKHTKCAAYNSTGVTEVPAQAAAVVGAQEPPRQQNASMTMPEIACVVPKVQKN